MGNVIVKKSRRVIAMSALALAAMTVAGPAEAANVRFKTWTSDGTAFASGTVYSGQARLRADCAYAPDQYSGWVGRGYRTLAAGKCPWGIRGAIVETRY